MKYETPCSQHYTDYFRLVKEQCVTVKNSDQEEIVTATVYVTLQIHYNITSILNAMNKL